MGTHNIIPRRERGMLASLREDDVLGTMLTGDRTIPIKNGRVSSDKLPNYPPAYFRPTLSIIKQPLCSGCYDNTYTFTTSIFQFLCDGKIINNQYLRNCAARAMILAYSERCSSTLAVNTAKKIIGFGFKSRMFDGECMSKLAIVTYLRDQEQLTQELLEIGNRLQQCYPGLAMKLYVDSLTSVHAPSAEFPIHVTCLQGTKYRKILDALKHSGDNYLLSLDNDIAANISGLLGLIDQTIYGNFDLGWGLVRSHRVSSFVSRLVEVDKLVSHMLLRPVLWRLRLGVTIPGQCFLLKTESFRNSLPSTDTYLDDLSIGLYAVKHRLRYHYVRKVVAFELPSYTFIALWKQRTRWATGFRQCLSCDSIDKSDRRLLWVHAFCYHLVPILQVMIMVTLALTAPLACFGWLVIISVFAVRRRPRAVGMAFVYSIVFPVFHIGWWYQFFRAKP